MKTKLLKVVLNLIGLLLSVNTFAQAEAVFTDVNTTNGEVTITNIGNASTDISSYQLCVDGFIYDAIGGTGVNITSGNTMLAPGATVTLTWNDIPLAGNATLMLYDLSGGGGFGNINNVRDVVRWGNSNFRNTQIANNWVVGESVSVAGTSGIITTGGVRGGNAAAWITGGTLSIGEDFVLGEKNNVMVYPNPVVNTVNFKINKKVNRVSVFNILGREVLKIDAADANNLNVENLSKGTYFLNFEIDNKIIVARFVKR